MKKFTAIIEEMYRNQYSNILQTIVVEKIPCAFFSPYLEPVQQIGYTKNLSQQGVNLVSIIAHKKFENSPVPVTLINDVAKMHPKPRYVLIVGYDPANRVAMSFCDRFASYGIDMILLLGNSSLADSYFDEYMNHLVDIEEIFDRLPDDASRESVVGFMLSRVSQKINYIKFDPAPQYLLTGFMPRPGDVAIDGGACDGATAVMFKDLGCEVYSFEMSHENFQLASKLAAEKNFVVENFGLGAFRQTMKYVPGGAGACLVAEQDNDLPSAQVIKLDEYVHEKNLSSVDFIKLDVEGSELAALKGAAETILRFKPRLAISAYHRPEDIYTLAKFLLQLNPDYEIAFRQYTSSYELMKYTFDNNPSIKELMLSYGIVPNMPNLFELVLYAR